MLSEPWLKGLVAREKARRANGGPSTPVVPPVTEEPSAAGILAAGTSAALREVIEKATRDMLRADLRVDLSGPGDDLFRLASPLAAAYEEATGPAAIERRVRELSEGREWSPASWQRPAELAPIVITSTPIGLAASAMNMLTSTCEPLVRRLGEDRQVEPAELQEMVEKMVRALTFSFGTSEALRTAMGEVGQDELVAQSVGEGPAREEGVRPDSGRGSSGRVVVVGGEAATRRREADEPLRWCRPRWWPRQWGGRPGGGPASGGRGRARRGGRV